MSLESVIIIQCEHLVTALVMVACPITILGKLAIIIRLIHLSAPPPPPIFLPCAFANVFLPIAAIENI
jgi:hypothetical protein